MQVNFDTHNGYNQNFGSAEITKDALLLLQSRYMSPKHIERYEKVIDEFIKKGDLIQGKLDVIHGSLTASIHSPGRHSESMTENTFSHLFRSPIHFIEKWLKRANRVEEKLKADDKLKEISSRGIYTEA